MLSNEKGTAWFHRSSISKMAGAGPRGLAYGRMRSSANKSGKFR
jgi:hypothetical protein